MYMFLNSYFLSSDGLNMVFCTLYFLCFLVFRSGHLIWYRINHLSSIFINGLCVLRDTLHPIVLLVAIKIRVFPDNLGKLRNKI